MEMLRSNWEAVALAVARHSRKLPVDRQALREWLAPKSRLLCVGTGLSAQLLELADGLDELLVCAPPVEALSVMSVSGGDAPSLRLFPSLEQIPPVFNRSADAALVLDSLPWLTSDVDRTALLSSIHALLRTGSALLVQVGERVEADESDYRLVSTTSFAGVRISQWIRSVALSVSACEVSELLRVVQADGEELEFVSRRVFRADPIERAVGLLESCGFRDVQLVAGADPGDSWWRSHLLVARAV